MRKVGVLGSGPVGQVLASGFLKNGHEVTIGTRDTSKLSDWATLNPEGKVGSFEETIQFGDIIVLAVGGKVSKDVLSLGKDNLKGKVIIDATNPISKDPPVNGVLKYFTSLDKSLMEELQTEFANARFVKAFNSVGSAFMVNPEFEQGKPTMFICGNDEEAKKEVSSILDNFGWEVEDMGSVEAARAIEPLAALWCIPGFLRNQWSHAFKLIKKK